VRELFGPQSERLIDEQDQQFLIPSAAGQAVAAVAMVIVNWMPMNK